MGGAPSLAAATTATAAFNKLALTETDDCPMRLSRDLAQHNNYVFIKKTIVTISVDTSPTTRLQLRNNKTHMYAKSFTYDAEKPAE